MAKPFIMIGMSGGVDSAVAALCLKQQGYDIEALFMKNWDEDDEETGCTAAEDLADATAVCDLLEIPLHKANFSSEYWDRVFCRFLDEYNAGRTPNPDILCNSEVKFEAFLDHALALGADCIATGHYAGVRKTDRGAELLCAKDTGKDQTYFLHRLNQQQLQRSMFPLADLTKDEVRALAREAGLPNAERKDSTGICFIGERDFRGFLNRWVPKQPGPVVNETGEQIGEHCGVKFYTLGQRQGLGIGGVASAGEGAWYVAEKHLATNTLTAVQGHDHPLLVHRGASVCDMHWIGAEPSAPLRCLARPRHRAPLQPCQVIPMPDQSWRVQFEQPQRALTPGQSLVFYQDGVCLGGGVMAVIFG